jgi:hypothetical protein
MHLDHARGLKQELLESLLVRAGLGMRPEGLVTQRSDAMGAIHRTLALGVARNAVRITGWRSASSAARSRARWSKTSASAPPARSTCVTSGA